MSSKPFPNASGPIDWFDAQAADAALLQLRKTFLDEAAELDQSGEFPFRNFERLRELGLLSLTIPRVYGGQQAPLALAARVVNQVAYGDPSTALILAMQYLQHARLHINQNWPDHLRERVSRDAVQQGALLNALRAEADMGTPTRGGLPATTATRTDDGWLLNGSKIYSTGSHGLTWMLIWARSDDPDPLVGAWLVRKDSPGVRIREDWDNLGMRATASHEVILEQVRVPLDQAVNVSRFSAPRPEYDPEGQLWMAVLVASVYDGVAQAARDWFVNWAIERKPSALGASLATLPRFQEIVGRIDALLFSNRVLLESAAQGQLAADAAGKIKYLTTNQAIQAVELALEVSGNRGLSRRNALERHYRNVLCSRVHNPQDDVLLLNTGKAAFANPPA